jgi:hypothetical protein
MGSAATSLSTTKSTFIVSLLLNHASFQCNSLRAAMKSAESLISKLQFTTRVMILKVGSFPETGSTRIVPVIWLSECLKVLALNQGRSLHSAVLGYFTRGGALKARIRP